MPKHSPESTLNVWASVAKHRETIEYDRMKVTPKSAAWEEFSTHKVGSAVVAGDYVTSPSREDCLELVRFTTEVVNDVELKVPIDEVRKVRNFKGSSLSSVEEDYLHVESLGITLVGRHQWALLRSLLLCFYPRKGPLRDERICKPEDHPWVMEYYDGKNPERDFHRRCRRMVRWFRDWV